MAISLQTFYPFAGQSVGETEWRAFAKYMLATGIIRNSGDNLFQVYGDSSGMQVKIKTGTVWAQGHWGQNTSEVVHSIASNSSGSTRLDRVVLRANFVTHLIETDVLTGSTTAPAVTQNTSMYEMSLAVVTVTNGAVTIAAAQVADDRTQYVSGTYGPGLLIQEVVTTGSVGTVTFSNIPQTYKHLRILAAAKNNDSVSRQIYCQLNGDSTSSYDLQWHRFDSTTITSGRINGGSAMEVGWSVPSAVNQMSASEFTLTGYAKTNLGGKTSLARSGYLDGAGSLKEWGSTAVYWANGNPITSITLFSAASTTWVAGTIFSLYGM